MHWRRKWQSTPVFLPGESQGPGSLVAAVGGVARSRTRLKRRSSSGSSAGPVVAAPRFQAVDLVAPQYSGSSQSRDQTVSLALTGGFFTTEPPGKPWLMLFRSIAVSH